MAKDQFQIGELVQLKSGGPKMTVDKPEAFPVGKIRCTWFSGSKLSHGYFDPATLKKYEEEKND